MRWSIAGLMGAVVAAALAMAALRSLSALVSGAATMVTCGALGVGVMGAVFADKTARVHWLGFALCGGAYLAAAYLLNRLSNEFPTITLLSWVTTTWGAPPRIESPFGGYEHDLHFLRTAHCVWALALGMVGSLMARLVMGAEPAHTAESANASESVTTQRKERPRWPGLAMLLLSAGVIIASLALLESTFDNGLWSGMTVLLTLAALGLAFLAAVFARGKRRASWFGAALLGVGYVALVMTRDPDLESWAYLAADTLVRIGSPAFQLVVPSYPGSSQSPAAANARVWKALEKPTSVRFGDAHYSDEELKLIQEANARGQIAGIYRPGSSDELLKLIQEATRRADGKSVPTYIDPFAGGDIDMNQVAAAPDEERLALREKLQRCLGEFGLSYSVRDGVLSIERDGQAGAIGTDPFRLVGHCLLVLIAAGCGGLVGGCFGRFR
jgi:hypothetical protein